MTPAAPHGKPAEIERSILLILNTPDPQALARFDRLLAKHPDHAPFVVVRSAWGRLASWTVTCGQETKGWQIEAETAADALQRLLYTTSHLTLDSVFGREEAETAAAESKGSCEFTDNTVPLGALGELVNAYSAAPGECPDAPTPVPLTPADRPETPPARAADLPARPAAVAPAPEPASPAESATPGARTKSDGSRTSTAGGATGGDAPNGAAPGAAGASPATALPAETRRKPKRAHAVELAEQGFPVFPLKPDCTPAFKGWQESATCATTAVAKMWTDADGAPLDYNIGIATGRLFRDTGKYLNVIDVDVKAGKEGDKSLRLLGLIYDELPPTRETRTASGGGHLFFLTPVPMGNSVQKIGWGLDVRGRGGYVVAPGSFKKGKPYVTANDLPIADCPEWLFEMAGAAKERKAPDLDPDFEWDSPEGMTRAAHYLAVEAPPAVEGDGGDNQTFQVMCRVVRDFGVRPETALDIALEHYNDRCCPPWDAEELLRKAQNAYEHGTNAIGCALASREFEPVEVDETKKPPAERMAAAEDPESTGDQPPARRGLYYVRWRDAIPTLDQPYLIDEVIELGTTVVTYGDSNTGKSYTVLDQAFCIATGRDWNGRKVKQGLVVYVAAEGGTGFQKRIEAFRRHYDADDIPFALVPCPIDMHSVQTDTVKLIKLIQQAEAEFGAKCVLVVVDTLARAMGTGDENTAVDMGIFVRHCDRVRHATGATVNIIHHTGKDKAKGARGSSALRAATDTEIEIDNGVLSVTKQRDLAKIEPVRFSLIGVDVGQRADGKPVTACIVQWRAPAEAEFAAPLTPPHQEALRALENLLDSKKAGGKPTTATFKAWADALAAVRAERGKASGQNQALDRSAPVLMKAGLVAKTQDGQYVRTGAK